MWKWRRPRSRNNGTHKGQRKDDVPKLPGGGQSKQPKKKIPERKSIRYINWKGHLLPKYFVSIYILLYLSLID